MPKKDENLHQNAPDTCNAALLIIDMINDLEFPKGEAIAGPALEAAKNIAKLKKRAKEFDIPVVYANDNFGRWRSNFRDAVQHCLQDKVRGRALVEVLKPDQDDYFVLKPKHSAFYATPLDLLLQHLGCRRLILCGIAANMCVQFTASDAYIRDFELYVPEDCIASYSPADNCAALQYMREVLRANTNMSTALDFKELRA